MFGIDEVAGKVAERILDATKPKTIFDLLKQPSTIAGLLGLVPLVLNASSVREGILVACSGVSGILLGRNTGRR